MEKKKKQNKPLLFLTLLSPNLRPKEKNLDEDIIQVFQVSR